LVDCREMLVYRIKQIACFLKITTNCRIPTADVGFLNDRDPVLREPFMDEVANFGRMVQKTTEQESEPKHALVLSQYSGHPKTENV